MKFWSKMAKKRFSRIRWKKIYVTVKKMKLIPPSTLKCECMPLCQSSPINTMKMEVSDM